MASRIYRLLAHVTVIAMMVGPLCSCGYSPAPPGPEVAKAPAQPAGDEGTARIQELPTMVQYPQIAGTWREGEGDRLIVTITQAGNRFVAETTYMNDANVEVHWTADGIVSKDGDVTAKLVHTKPAGYLAQTRTGKLSPDGTTIRGHAAWEGGAHDFTWSLMKRAAQPKASPAPKEPAEFTFVELPDLPGDADQVALFPEGDIAAACGGDGKVQIYRIPSKEVMASFAGFPGDPRLAVSPDGKLLAQASNQETRVKIWDVEKRQEVKTLSGHKLPVSDLAFLPDGAKLATSSQSTDPGTEGEIRIWNLAETSEPVSLDPKSGVTSIAFSPDGNYLASAGLAKASDGKELTGEVNVWDLKTRQAKTTLTSKMGPVYQVAFSPDGKMLAMAERNGLRSLQVSHRIRLADAQTGEEKGTLLGHAGAIYGLAFSPDGMFVVSAGRDRLLQIWQVPTMSRRAVRDLNGYHKGKVTFSRRGDRLAVAGFSGAATPHATVWGLRYALEAEPRYPHFDPFDVEILRGRTAARIERLAFSSDGKSLALFSREAGTWIYDTATWSGRRLRGSTLLQVAAFSPDLSRAAVLGKTLSIWNLTNPREILDLQDPAREVYRVTFSPDGRYLFSAHQYAELKVRDVRGREVAAPTLPPEAVPTCIAVSSDGSRIAAGGALFSGDEASKDRAGPVCIWDMKRPEKPNGLKTFFHGDTVYDVALSSDGSLVASMGQKGVVKIWEIAHGKDPWTCPGYLAAFAPDGSVLATTGTGKERTSVVLWDTKTHAKLRTLTGGHFLGVNVLSFSPHGNRLASGGSDGLVTVWNPQTGKEDWTPAK